MSLEDSAPGPEQATGKAKRLDKRSNTELRPLLIRRAVNPYAEGSVEISAGKTKLLITASVEKEVPPWMKADGVSGGWITAEYGMLPRATHTRNRREASQGKQSGRTLEIQRLIGRALRAAVDIKSLPPVTIKFDCDVISADGGTRTTAITGAWVALYDALRWTVSQGIISELPKINQVAAISVGVVYGEPRVDLEYVEDSKADFDMNVVLDDSGRVIEVQGTAEDRAVSRAVLNGLLDLAEGGIKQIMSIQREVISKPVDN